MRFYTNFHQYKSEILLRGYDNGKRVLERVPLKPYLFVPTKKDGVKYRTIRGKPVEKVVFENTYEARKFIQKYERVRGFEIYGSTNFGYPFINDHYPGIIDYDPKLVSVCNLDIEVYAKQGFPHADLAEHPIVAITMERNGKIVCLGLKAFINRDSDVTYILCKDEADLFMQFLAVWNSKEWFPDVITGWNCMPVGQHVWLQNSITTLEKLTHGQKLFDSTVVNISPKNIKSVWEIKLSTGHTIQSSSEHRFPVVVSPANKYTNFQISRKPSSWVNKDLTLIEIKNEINNGNVVFLDRLLKNNTNMDVENITDSQLYLAGLVYTDGTLCKKGSFSDGFRIFQSDSSMLESLDAKGMSTAVVGPHKGCFSRGGSIKLLGPAADWIYDHYQKKLNIEKLSLLSTRQWLLFLSGLLDGDGFKCSGRFALCNYNNDITTIAELSSFNGIQTTINSNGTVIRFHQLQKKSLNLLKHSRWESITVLTTPDKNSKQRAREIKWKYVEVGGEHYARTKIVNVEDTKTQCLMMDIETDKHTFIANGMLTHNCESFDIPYIINRGTKIIGKEAISKLSPWGLLEQREFVNQYKKKQVAHEIIGVSTLDYLPIYKKFSFKNLESNTLNYVAHEEVGEGKLDHSHFESLADMYEKDPQLYIEYNIKDVRLVKKIDDKLKLFEQIYAIAFDGKVNFQDALSTVRMWDVIIHNYLLGQGIVVSPMKMNEKTDLIRGAYVKPTMVGMHKWVVSFDLNSLYPHLIMGYNISPETLVGALKEELSIEDFLDGKLNTYKDKIKEQNLCVAGSSYMFDRDRRGFLPTLMDKMYNDRVVFKTKMIKAKQDYEKTPTKDIERLIAQYHNMQLAKKIQMNACYGALSNIYFRWFDIRLAESITMSGQLAARWITGRINDYLNKLLGTNEDYVVASDTDSMYIIFDKVVEKVFEGKNPSKEDIVNFIDKSCKTQIEPFIDRSFQDLADYTNAYEQKMKMKRESIAEKGLWLGKKHYVLNVWDNEGVRYGKPKIKMVGIEAVKSSTPEACRDAIKAGLGIVMNGTELELRQHIADYRIEFGTLEIEEVAKPTSVRGLLEYSSSNSIYRKGAPIHVRAALLFNRAIKDRQLDKALPISDGDKMKYCYLTVPNPLKENVVGLSNMLPRELGLNKYIDYDKQFEKTYLKFMDGVCKLIGWEVVERATLDSFFGE